MTLNAVRMPDNPVRHIQAYRQNWEKYLNGLSNNGLATNRGHDLRRTGWSEFERIGFPIHRRGNELWKYTDLRTIDRTPFRSSTTSIPLNRDQLAAEVPLPTDWTNIVFVDGVLNESLSAPIELPPGFKFGTVSDFDELGKLAPCDQNAFVSMNSAFLPDGAYLDVQEGTTGAKPIHLIFVTTECSEGERAVYPRIAASIRSGAEATLIETHLSTSDAPHLSVPVVEISLQQEAALKHYRVQLDNENSYHFATTRVKQGSGSNYQSTSFSVGSSIGRNDVFTMLDGEYAESTLHGVYLTTNRQHQDNEISTTHSAPNCTSDQYYKGILSGRSRAVFSGKITVERGAQKTDANQKDLNLLLSHGAEVDTKPSLEIYADDVKCGHGATAGHVDEDTLFYLQSRGVDYDTAQAMLIRGFAAEILDEFTDDTLRDFLEGKLDNLMPELQVASDTIGTA